MGIPIPFSSFGEIALVALRGSLALMLGKG
jgi:hypothetical protein